MAPGAPSSGLSGFSMCSDGPFRANGAVSFDCAAVSARRCRRALISEVYLQESLSCGESGLSTQTASGRFPPRPSLFDEGNPAGFRSIQCLRLQPLASTTASIQFVMAAGLFVKNTCRLRLPPRYSPSEVAGKEDDDESLSAWIAGVLTVTGALAAEASPVPGVLRSGFGAAVD